MPALQETSTHPFDVCNVFADFQWGLILMMNEDILKNLSYTFNQIDANSLTMICSNSLSDSLSCIAFAMSAPCF